MGAREVDVGNSSLSGRRLLFCEKRSPAKHEHCRRLENLVVAKAEKNRSNFDDRRLVHCEIQSLSVILLYT
ncbi:unnamed protein product [Ilex paraguariensis]|uniref:Uncharacterized protein n=1 Tax=Ilex paraguariensis TaxID=185542 RepID=A0ABC8RTX2_9AQUA